MYCKELCFKLFIINVLIINTNCLNLNPIKIIKNRYKKIKSKNNKLINDINTDSLNSTFFEKQILDSENYKKKHVDTDIVKISNDNQNSNNTIPFNKIDWSCVILIYSLIIITKFYILIKTIITNTTDCIDIYFKNMFNSTNQSYIDTINIS